MIDTVRNLLFRCSHRRITRPMAPITKAGTPHSRSYVVCLDCGKQFEYDLQAMKIGKAIERGNDAAILPDERTPAKRGLLYALAAALPAAVLLRAAWKGKSQPGPSENRPPRGRAG
jgi:hypothetical protein